MGLVPDNLVRGVFSIQKKIARDDTDLLPPDISPSGFVKLKPSMDCGYELNYFVMKCPESKIPLTPEQP